MLHIYVHRYIMVCPRILSSCMGVPSAYFRGSKVTTHMHAVDRIFSTSDCAHMRVLRLLSVFELDPLLSILQFR